MTIEEAIEHCKEQAAKLRTTGDCGCVECAAEHEQLAEWLVELKQRREAKGQRGEWILTGKSWITKSHDFKCSVCGNYFRVYDDVTLNAGRGDANFCPNCGADMREAIEDGES